MGFKNNNKKHKRGIMKFQTISMIIEPFISSTNVYLNIKNEKTPLFYQKINISDKCISKKFISKNFFKRLKQNHDFRSFFKDTAENMEYLI